MKGKNKPKKSSIVILVLSIVMLLTIVIGAALIALLPELEAVKDAAFGTNYFIYWLIIWLLVYLLLIIGTIRELKGKNASSLLITSSIMAFVGLIMSIFKTNKVDIATIIGFILFGWILYLAIKSRN